MIFLPGRETRVAKWRKGTSAREEEKIEFDVRAKGLKRRFGGSSRRKLTQVRTVNLRTRRSRIPRDATKTVCVLSLGSDSRIKFTTDARLYFQTGWSSRTHLKAPPRIFLRSKAPSWRRWRVCATNDSTRSKDADFRQEADECI